MANVSANNFLNLLFGGAQQGIGEFRRQQGQQTDLLLTLQNMLQQRKQQEFQRGIAERQIGLSEAAGQRAQEQLDIQKSQIREGRTRQAGMDYQTALQQSLEQHRGKVQQRTYSELGLPRGFGTLPPSVQAALVAGGTKNKTEHGRRLALSTAANAIVRNKANYQYIDEDVYSNIKNERERGTWEPVKSLDDNIIYRRLHPNLAAQLTRIQNQLQALGGAMDPMTAELSAPAAGTFEAVDDTSAEDMLRFLDEEALEQ